MHDVANLANVSHQTVSRVMNGYPGIRPETRAKVQAAITQLGYRRNLAARTLVTGRSSAIGILSPSAPDFGPMSSRLAVERAAREAGLHALGTSTDSTEAQVKDSLEFLLGRSIDALVLLAPHNDVLAAVDAQQVDLPKIYLLTGEARGKSSISIDQRLGVKLAMDHLLSLGHTRIQHVAGPDDFAEAQLRRDTYLESMAAAGLEPYPVIVGDWSVESGYRAGQQIAPDVTAVFCANDQMAMGLIHALHDVGRLVPRDVSVGGFDDIPEARHSMPPLTTVHQDFDAVGHLAVDVVLARIAGTEEPPNTAIAPWLIARQSTAPVRTT